LIAPLAIDTSGTPRDLTSAPAMKNEGKTREETARQHLLVNRAMWDIVDKYFDPVRVLTRKGYELIPSYSIKAAHPVLPHVLHFLAMMCALANGAKSRWFPNVMGIVMEAFSQLAVHRYE
jgi:hypothetical protein